MARFHRVRDVHDGRTVATVSLEHFATDRHAATGYCQRDAHLLAVAVLVACITELGLEVTLRLTFELRAGNVVQQQVVLEFKLFSRTVFQKRF